MAELGSVTVAALYCFAPMTELETLRDSLQKLCAAQGVRGTLLLAAEGINGTIAGSAEAIDALVTMVSALPGCGRLEVKFSAASSMPFFRLKVLVKREIVTMGLDGIDPTTTVGTYVSATDWNELISDPTTLVIDTRNAYEAEIGTFPGAVDPRTDSFREFPGWFREHKETLLTGKRRVAMFCTGGIRCEKSTAFLKSEGIDEVYHLQGGILRYLEEVPEDASLWQGECFVFDQRVSVGHGLRQGTFGRCHGCRHPLSPEEMTSPLYEEGVSCPRCHGSRAPERLAGYAERQRQVQLASQRGEEHLGVNRQTSGSSVKLGRLVEEN